MTRGFSHRFVLAAVVLAGLAGPGPAAAGKDEPAAPSAEAIAGATFAEPAKADARKPGPASRRDDRTDPLTIKVQALLDRPSRRRPARPRRTAASA